MDKKVLVAYASKHGATAEIAEKISQVLREAGLQTTVMPVGQIDDLASFQAVIVGSAVYIGQWQKSAVKFLQGNQKQLAQRPVWLFSSGPTGRQAPPKSQASWLLPESLQPIASRIHPQDIAVFQGALDPEKLNFIEKTLIRKVGASVGDFRDWQAIAAWAEGITAALIG